MKALTMYHHELKQERDRINKKLESLDRRISHAESQEMKDQLRVARKVHEAIHRTVFSFDYDPD